MIKTRKELKHFLKEDAKANGIDSYADYIFKLLYGNIHAHAFRYLKSLRKYEYYENIHSPLRLLYRLYNRRLGLKYHMALQINRIGYGFKINHFEGGIVVNCRNVGNYCSINTGVLIGNKGGNENVPTIGDHVELCTGSKIIGNISIGDNVIVAPNAVVVKDVPSNKIVAGVPARIINNNIK